MKEARADRGEQEQTLLHTPANTLTKTVLCIMHRDYLCIII